MAVLDAARIDYSLLAGAESLGDERREQQLRERNRRQRSGTGVSVGDNSDTDVPTSLSASSYVSTSDSPASSSSSSASEDEAEQRMDNATKYAFRTPKKVASQDPNDWLWMHDEEPHRSRRRAILKAHPEVTKLMGYEPLTKYVVLLVMAIQFATAYALRDTHPLSWKFVLAAYAIGGTANQNLFLAIHEITHNLAFRSILPNRLFAIFTNLPIGIPYGMMFKKYHMEHHRALGVDGVDTDLPTKAELMVLRNVAGKAFFCTFQILFYALRPGFVRSQKLTRWHAINFSTQLLFDALVVYLASFSALSVATGTINYRPLIYFIMSSFFAGSLHPCAGHFIAEHYLFEQWDQETWSYYGCLNKLTYNVGYHNEHHDFPSIPWTRLPRLHEVANEFYKDLPTHTSWCKVTFDFIFRSDVGLFSRVKRMPPVKTGSPAASAMDKDGLEDAKGAGGKGSYGGMKDD